MSNILQTIGVNNLALRGGSTAFNRLDRFFNTVAEAEAAVAGGDYTPDPNATNGVLIADVGFAIWNFDTSTFDAVNFPQLTAEGVLTQKINDIFDNLVVTVGQTADGLITEKGLRVAGDVQVHEVHHDQRRRQDSVDISLGRPALALDAPFVYRIDQEQQKENGKRCQWQRHDKEPLLLVRYVRNGALRSRDLQIKVEC